MMPGTPADSPTDRADLRARVQKALTGFLGARTGLLEQISEDLGPVAEAAADFLLAGGKRLRPAFCYWGWRGAGGPDVEEIVTAAAGLELLHACALVHDDVMDASDTRRGRPAVHRRFAALHGGQAWHGDPAEFGTAVAVLLGDLFLVWADQMLVGSGLPDAALRRAWPTYDEMRVELMAGQYLDLLEQAVGGQDVARSLRIARYKSAKYTVERPLHLGGLLAGAGAEVLAVYSAYGVPLGEAFQLRDDVLGVFGNPSETGKPTGDDLRGGKRTALVAHALERATDGQAAVLRRCLGDPGLAGDGVARLQEVIEQTGALALVEELIESRARAALDALRAAPLDPEAVEVLTGLAAAVTGRRG